MLPEKSSELSQGADDETEQVAYAHVNLRHGYGTMTVDSAAGIVNPYAGDGAAEPRDGARQLTDRYVFGDDDFIICCSSCTCSLARRVRLATALACALTAISASSVMSASAF